MALGKGKFELEDSTVIGEIRIEVLDIAENKTRLRVNLYDPSVGEDLMYFDSGDMRKGDTFNLSGVEMGIDVSLPTLKYREPVTQGRRFEEGDKVFCQIFGWGVVTNISDDGGSLPILVKFSKTLVRCYTLEGHPFTGENVRRTLFHDEPDFVVPADPVRRPHLELDAPIQVKEQLSDYWRNRHFSQWSPDGEAVCFVDGKTSFSLERVDDEDRYFGWTHWRLPEDPE
ncbi:MAG: hypothetical protein JRJ45_00470 [Deltaproteobacteria bacterium]|nr:hypothetical protein [Deltaproteobacteria bacterium]